MPVGFSGYWCERCEKPAENIPEEAGTLAKCNLCHKWTVVWVPPRTVTSDELQVARHGNYQRTRPTAERAKEMFAAMRAVVEGGAAAPPYQEDNINEYTR